jgi:dihydrofolate synthase/folylpolyglutamate synthase
MDAITKKYNQALEYIYSFVDYSLKHSSELAKAEFNLDRMFALMESLGNPQNSYKTIHITGTKGKGSTAAFCNAALIAGGYQVGLYTSPHLLDFTERIQVNNANISHRDFVELVEQIKPHVAKIPKLTTFEITTALAFMQFARQKVDVAVIEVGLGGRLDATNIITPCVSVITTISFDHTAVLGNTLALIAAEKGGIIKPGVPVVIGPQAPEAWQILARIAMNNQCPLADSSKEYSLTPLEKDLTGQHFIASPRSGQKGISLRIPLLGQHQVENALTALCALRLSGLDLSQQQVIDGFAAVKWPCRFEIAQQNPTLIFDSAHNEDAFRRLGQTVRAYFPRKKIVLILGISEDKHLTEMIDQVEDLMDTLLLTRSFHPRALPVEELAAKLANRRFAIESHQSTASALLRALEIAQKDGSIVISAGSMFVTAEVKEAWMKREQS